MPNNNSVRTSPVDHFLAALAGYVDCIQWLLCFFSEKCMWQSAIFIMYSASFHSKLFHDFGVVCKTSVYFFSINVVFVMIA